MLVCTYVDFICSHMYACVNACVCAYAIHICVSGKARIQVQICLMQRMHSHTIVSKFKKKRIVTDISGLTLRSAKFSSCALPQLNKGKIQHKSLPLYRSKSLPESGNKVG